MDSLNLTPIFFGALEFPEYAWPTYFHLEQQKSDWSRGIYLTTLDEIYYAYVTQIQFKHNITKRKTPDLSIDDIVIDVSEFTGTLGIKTINRKTLFQLHKAIYAARFIDIQVKKVSAIETLAFVECALAFIKKEYQYMAGKTTIHGFRPRTNSYFDYVISQDGPFFDFTKFKTAVREINLIQQNRIVFEATLEPFQKTAHQIVELWNESIAPIVHNDSGKFTNVQSELVRVEFSSVNMHYGWVVDEEMFDLKPHKHWLCQDLAYYAANISNLIMNEIFLPAQFSHRDDKKQFIPDLLSAIHLMQEEEIKVDLSLSGEIENTYRNAIWKSFCLAGYQAEREVLKGTGKVDLKITHPSISKKVMEFKGWWNDSRKNVVQQTIRYLTEFEGEGYIFIVNTTGKSIIDSYSEIVNNPDTGIVEAITEISYKKYPAYKYYKSIHEHNGQKKVIYHFIFLAIQSLQKKRNTRSKKDNHSIK